MKSLKKVFFFGISIFIGVFLLSQAARGAGNGDTRIVDIQINRSTDSSGITTEKRILKKVRTRTVVDFEEASIEGKVKKPNAAYLLHGADLEFQHLYQLKHSQKNRILSSYEYLR